MIIQDKAQGGRKPRRKQAKAQDMAQAKQDGARRTQGRKPRQWRKTQDMAQGGARRRKAQAMAQASQAKPSKAHARAQDMAQGRTQAKPRKGARRAQKRRAINGAPLI